MTAAARLRRAADMVDRIAQARRDWQARAEAVPDTEEAWDIAMLAAAYRTQRALTDEIIRQRDETKRRSVERAEQLAAAIGQQERAERRLATLIDALTVAGRGGAPRLVRGVDLEGWALEITEDEHGAIASIRRIEGGEYATRFSPEEDPAA